MLTAEQLEIRQSGIGASEAAAALGVSRYASPWQLWARKLGLISGPSGWVLSRGDALEPLMLRWFSERTGAALEQPGTLRHPRAPTVLATPDALATWPDGRRSCVECKAPGGRVAHYWGAQGTDEIDPEYLPQVLVQLAVTGLDWCDVVASIAGEEPVLYRVHAVPRLQERIVLRLGAWWDRHIIGRERPDMDGSDEARSWLAAEFPRDNYQWLDSTEEIDRWAEQLRDARQREASARAERDVLENRLRAVIADATGIRGETWRCSWRPDKNGRRNFRFTYEETP